MIDAFIQFYFNTLLLMIYLSAIETFLIKKLSLIGFTSFGFAWKYDTWFSKYRSGIVFDKCHKTI